MKFTSCCRGLRLELRLIYDLLSKAHISTMMGQTSASDQIKFALEFSLKRC